MEGLEQAVKSKPMTPKTKTHQAKVRKELEAIKKIADHLYSLYEELPSGEKHMPIRVHSKTAYQELQMICSRMQSIINLLDVTAIK